MIEVENDIGFILLKVVVRVFLVVLSHESICSHLRMAKTGTTENNSHQENAILRF